MLTVTNLQRSFGAQQVFTGANWFVPSGARVGLVGANGSGKSTLLRMIAGVERPDDGAIVLQRGTSVGYLPQEVLGVSGRSVRQEALDAFADVLALERECRELEAALAESRADDPDHDEIMKAYADARERWDHEGSYDHESQAESVLVGLGFRTADFDRDAGEFSGGWQMRLALARLLLKRPRLLLLDEPTNHLDIDARNWLEEFLSTYPGTVILVAHDRYFLDVTVNRITEVSRGRLSDYHSTYTRYLVEKEERQAREVEAYRAQQEEIERIQAFVSRFRYQASKAALVQSRVKQLERIERLPAPEGGPPAIHFRFPACERSGRIVLELRGATKRYGNLSVYEGLDLAVERGRKVALVGPNGAGKSTLIKLLGGTEPLTSGSRQVGHNVTVGYFAQDQTQVLNPERTVLDEITAAAPYEMVPQVRSLLGAFLFHGDSAYKRIRVLSGGERNRLALAKLLLQASNCLLLDEPTNHLDIYAKEVLLEALQNYGGTVVLVAHDRYLLDQLPDEVVEVGSGQAVRYLGNYEDYLRQKAAQAGGAAPVCAGKTATVGNPPAAREDRREGAPDGNGASPKRTAKRGSNPAARREREIAQMERDISERESELAGITTEINDPDFYRSHANPQALFSRYAQLKREIEVLYSKLERLEQIPAAG